MKKNIKKMHTLSSVARSATLLGTCVAGLNGVSAYQVENQDPFWMDVMDGSASGSVGGGGSSADFNGGTFLALPGTATPGAINLTISLTCAAISQRFSCVGALLYGSSLIQEITYQDTCDGGLGIASATFTFSCTTALNYAINFLCVNQTAQKVFANSSSTLPFTCT